jgi:LemA protein
MTWVFIGLIAVILGWTLAIYNRLVRAKNQQAEAWSGVDVQLKKRADLVPALVECVSGYRDHEASVQQQVAATRALENPADKLRALVAVAENYPELKAGENFQDLMKKLVAIEDDLQFARRYYNGSVRDFRNLAESFPSNVVAGWFKFQPNPFFEVDSVLERNNPEVKL